MIKINLLHNDLTMPTPRERTGEEKATTGSSTIQSEAKKSTRRFVYTVVLLLALISGGVALYMQRYEAVDFVEKFTGPLNILPPREDAGPSAEALEEARLEKIRQQYMANTSRIQNRDYKFMLRIDSLKSVNAKIQVANVTLDNDNTFIIVLFGKTKNDIIEFTRIFFDYKPIEEFRPQEIKPSREMPGFGFNRTLQGSLRVLSSDADSVKTNYLELDKAKKKMLLLAKGDSLKITEEGKMTTSNGPVMTAYAGTYRLEGRMEKFFKFVHQINQLSLNIELTKYNIEYVPDYEKKKADKKKPKSDVVRIDYNVLVPTKVTAAAK